MVGEEEIDVVISGIGGLLPKSNNIEEFQHLLFSNEQMVQKGRPGSDPNATHGFLSDIDKFDATFFGIQRSIAINMDLLFRKSLESTYEAIIDAGVSPSTLRGRKIAVIMSSTFTECEINVYKNLDRGAGIMTNARTMFPNRISYWMHAIGPSISLYNNWIGGMSSLEAAYNFIKSGECEGAIVGAFNTVGNEQMEHQFNMLGVTAKDGKTKAFDEDASGYVRSDGIVVLFLQRADLARRHYATIVNVESIFKGNNSGTFSVMSVDSARNFLTKFYQNAQVDPSTVQYVETYGAAIKLIDNFELNVLDQVFTNSSRVGPLLIGSVKSNMGHSEAASVLISVIKTIIAMEKREIPGNLNYERNEKVPALRNGKIKVVTKNTAWPGTLAAVNGYGLVSSCGHILLKSNTQSFQNVQEKVDKLPKMYIFSTRTEEGIQQIINKIKSYETINDDYMNLINGVFANNIPGHLIRGYLMRNESNSCTEEFSHYSGQQRPVWFVYSGMGSQWVTMGKDLMKIPIFATAIQKCHAILEPHGLNLLDIICSDKNPDVFNKILHSFVGIAAIQIGLTDILFALGIRPDNLIGHSVGELGCAYADGCLTAEQMILSAYYRGRASQEVELIPGLMAAVGVGADKLKSIVPPTIDIACRNGPESCTISGPAKDMLEFVSRLQAMHIFARAVDVAGIAYHSRYIKPAAPLLFNYCKKIIPEPKLRSAKWLSSSVPEANGGWNTEKAQYASAEYLTNNLLSCVHLEALLKYIPNDAIVIEVAPHGLLQAILKRSIPSTCDNIALTKRGEKGGAEFLFKNIGKLYMAGLQLDISKLYDEDTDKSKPVVPCSRGTPSLASLVHWNYSDNYESIKVVDLVNENKDMTYQLSSNSESFRYLNGHRIYDIDEDSSKEGTITVPLTVYMSLIHSENNNNIKLNAVVFEDVQLYRHHIIPDQSNKYMPLINIMKLPSTNCFEVNDRYGMVASGRCILSTEKEITSNNIIIKRNIGQKIDELTSDEVYQEFSNRGHNFQHVFHSIHKLEIYDTGMLAHIEWKNQWHIFLSSMLQMAIFRYGQSSHCPVDTVFIRSVSCLLNDKNTPAEGSTVEVIYNYTTDIISSSIITICNPRCQPYRLESDVFVTDKCYSIAPQKDFAGRINEESIAVINIKESIVNIDDLNSEVSWAKELNEMLNDKTIEYIYLLTRVFPMNGFSYFLAHIQSLPNGHRVRLIITLDSDAPEFTSISDSFYQPAFKPHKSNVSLYCDGSWEYLYTISTKLKDKSISYKNKLCSLISEQDFRRYLPDVNVQFVGINTVSMVPTLSNNMSVEKQLGVIDYTGLETKSNCPVIGLATINTKNSLTSDPVLRWPLPRQWSLADGATVPFAYSIAYYALCECAQLQPGESILIHNGCSSIGQAMIRVASSIGCAIYTTVASPKQRSRLLKTLQMLQEGTIFEYTSNNFEMQVMEATKGTGVHVLVNCLPEDSLRASLRCVASLGRVILLLDENRLEEQYQESIGLSVFLNCFGMYGIRASKVLNLPENIKKKIYDHILKGIQERHVRPINKNIFRQNGGNELKNIINYLTGPIVTGTAVVPIEDLVKDLKNSPSQVNKIDSTYVIHGGDDINNIITLTHWLVTSYRAKNIAIIFSYSRNTNDKKILERNLTVIKTEQTDVTIRLLEVIENKPDLVLQQIVQQKITNIASVLILSKENNQSNELFIKKLQTIFPTTHIVLLSSVANANLINLERYHARNIKNVSFLRWDKKRRLPSIFKSLTTALEEVVDLFVRNNKIIDNVETIFTSEDFCSLLSSSISSILKYTPIKSDIVIESIVSRNPKKAADLAPVFIVPGLFGKHCTYTQNTMRNLLNPVYVLDAAYGTLSLDQLTVRLGEQIRNIFPSGPYNLIGVSTGGPLAIELAKHLETDLGSTVQLYLLDGAPDTLKHILSSSGDNTSFEVTLLKELLNIDDPNLVASLSTLPNWNTRIDAVLKQTCSKSKKTKEILDALKVRMDTVLSYLPSKRNFNGITHVIIPEETIRESTKVMEECKEINFVTIKGNHFTMLLEHAMVEYINDNIIHPPLYNY